MIEGLDADREFSFLFLYHNNNNNIIIIVMEERELTLGEEQRAR